MCTFKEIDLTPLTDWVGDRMQELGIVISGTGKFFCTTSNTYLRTGFIKYLLIQDLENEYALLQSVQLRASTAKLGKIVDKCLTEYSAHAIEQITRHQAGLPLANPNTIMSLTGFKDLTASAVLREDLTADAVLRK